MAYLKSKSIKVFPSAFRGKDSEGKLYDPKSYLTTEYNLTNITNKMTSKNSFVVSHISGNIKIVLLGYLFEITGIDTFIKNNSELNSSKDIYASIWITDVETYPTLVDRDNNTLLDSDSLFKGLYISGIDEVANNSGARVSLKILTRDSSGLYKVPNESTLIFSTSQINDGESNKSILDELHSKSFVGNLQGNATSSNKFSSNKKIELSGDITGTATSDGTSSKEGVAEWNISNTKIVKDAVVTDSIKDESVTNDKIANTTITNNKLVNKTITNDKIANTTIINDLIANNSIDSRTIKDNEVKTSKLADNSVTRDKINLNVVDTTQSTSNGISVSLSQNAEGENKGSIKVEVSSTSVTLADKATNVGNITNNAPESNADVKFTIGDKSFSKTVNNVAYSTDSGHAKSSNEAIKSTKDSFEQVITSTYIKSAELTNEKGTIKNNSITFTKGDDATTSKIIINDVDNVTKSLSGVSLTNIFEQSNSNITSKVKEATKATNDGDGNEISTTYLKSVPAATKNEFGGIKIYAENGILYISTK